MHLAVIIVARRALSLDVETACVAMVTSFGGARASRLLCTGCVHKVSGTLWPLLNRTLDELLAMDVLCLSLG